LTFLQKKKNHAALLKIYFMIHRRN